MGHAAALLLSAMGIVCRGVLLDFVIILHSISCIHKIPIIYSTYCSSVAYVYVRKNCCFCVTFV